MPLKGETHYGQTTIPQKTMAYPGNPAVPDPICNNHFHRAGIDTATPGSQDTPTFYWGSDTDQYKASPDHPLHLPSQDFFVASLGFGTVPRAPVTTDAWYKAFVNHTAPANATYAYWTVHGMNSGERPSAYANDPVGWGRYQAGIFINFLEEQKSDPSSDPYIQAFKKIQGRVLFADLEGSLSGGSDSTWVSDANSNLQVLDGFLLEIRDRGYNPGVYTSPLGGWGRYFDGTYTLNVPFVLWYAKGVNANYDPLHENFPDYIPEIEDVALNNILQQPLGGIYPSLWQFAGDAGSLTVQDPTNFTPRTAQEVSIPLTPSQPSDDAGTNPTGCVFSSSDNEVYLGDCFRENGTDIGDITSGFRFNNVQIPYDAHVASAHIRFTVDGRYAVSLNLNIAGEYVGNSNTFTASNQPKDRTSLTSAQVQWYIPDTDVWDLGQVRDTPDISGIIEEIVSHPNWSAGHSLSIIFQNINSRETRRVIAIERANFDPNDDLYPAELVVSYIEKTPSPTATPVPTTPAPTDTPVPTDTPTPTTPAPTDTPVPTEVPTETSTPNPPSCWCLWLCPQTAQPLTAGLAAPARALSVTVDNKSRIEKQAALLYRVRDEVLSKTPAGQHYIDTYYAHSAEIAQLMLSNPDLYEQGLNVIDALTPSLRALVNGRGRTVSITTRQVGQAQAFLDVLLPLASPGLQQSIIDEQAKLPLEQLSGLNMDQAWGELNQEATPTPTPEPTAYPATIAGLRSLLRDLHQQKQVDQKTYTHLNQILSVAEKQMKHGRSRAVITQLRVFIRFIQLQKRPHITPRAAQALINLAMAVIRNLQPAAP